MPGFAESASRQLLHNRAINIACYGRQDGLMDVEGHLIDLKPFDLVLSEHHTKVAGEPIHDMRLRLTFNEEMLIVDVDCVMDVPAHSSCVGALPSYEGLVGVRIGAGWLREARERITTVSGCTHITEMLQEMGTTAMQGMFGRASQARALGKKTQKMGHSVLDTCFGWRSGGELHRLRKGD